MAPTAISYNYMRQETKVISARQKSQKESGVWQTAELKICSETHKNGCNSFLLTIFNTGKNEHQVSATRP